LVAKHDIVRSSFPSNFFYNIDILLGMLRFSYIFYVSHMNIFADLHLASTNTYCVGDYFHHSRDKMKKKNTSNCFGCIYFFCSYWIQKHLK